MNAIVMKIDEYIGYKDNPIITAPAIDKLSAVADLPDDPLCGVTYSVILDWIKNHEVGIAKGGSTSRYALGVKIHYPTKKGDPVHLKCPMILVQITHPNCSKKQVRVEYNPAHMTEYGETYLDAMFTSMFGMEFYQFLFHCRFTRVDFCRNIVNRALEDYFIKSKWSKISQCVFNSEGKLETIYLGKCGGANIKAYDKTKQMHGQSSPHGTIRIEASCPINLSINELAKFPNPFERVVVYSTTCSNPPLGEAHWRAFQDSCHLRGISNAIKRQPVKHRSTLKKAIFSQPVSWWNITPDDWDWLLIDALDNAGLLNIPNSAPPLTFKQAFGEGA